MRFLKQNELIRCRTFCLQLVIKKYKHYNVYIYIYIYMCGNVILSAFVYGRQYRLSLLEKRVLRETAGSKGEGVTGAVRN
jgi:hypothetical protein